jgi:hypothetical protein
MASRQLVSALELLSLTDASGSADADGVVLRLLDKSTLALQDVRLGRYQPDRARRSELVWPVTCEFSKTSSA